MRKFKIGDKVKVKSWTSLVNEFGVTYDEWIDCGDVCFIADMKYLCGEIIEITEENFAGEYIEVEDERETWSLYPAMVHFLNDCEDTPLNVALDNTASLKMRIKYFEGSTKLQKITKGNWIDVYSNKDVFVPLNERAMIPLGFALELPRGWEGHLAPRSSTFKTWGVIQTNSTGVVDDTYIGDNDQWHMPVYCLQAKDNRWLEHSNSELDYVQEGTWIKQGDKIAQFRVMEVMPNIEFEEVESFGNKDRGGFGTTGSVK